MSHAHSTRVSPFGPFSHPSSMSCLEFSGSCSRRVALSRDTCGRFWVKPPRARDALVRVPGTICFAVHVSELCQLQRAAEFNSPGISGGPRPSEALPGPLNQSRPLPHVPASFLQPPHRASLQLCVSLSLRERERGRLSWVKARTPRLSFSLLILQCLPDAWHLGTTQQTLANERTRAERTRGERPRERAGELWATHTRALGEPRSFRCWPPAGNRGRPWRQAVLRQASSASLRVWTF